MPKGKALTTRIRIVTCAVALYQSRGYGTVTVHDICAASGLTRSAFYYHFNSKDEILDDYFLETDVFVMERLLPGLSRRGPLDQIYELLHLYLQRTVAAGPSVAGQILKRGIDYGIAFTIPRSGAVRALLLTQIENAQQEGLVGNQLPAAQLLEAIGYITGGVVFTWCSKNGKWDISTEFHRILNTLLLPAHPNER